MITQAEALGPPWKWLVEVGTGGTATPEYYRARGEFPGYVVLRISRTPAPRAGLSKPFVEPMQTIRRAFGRNFSRLPSVFGVSRQTLYNWLDGEQPKPPNQARIGEMAEAAQVFLAAKYTPSAADLGRSLLRGKSFLDLIAEGEDGHAMGERLVRLIERGLAARAKGRCSSRADRSRVRKALLQ
jgi:hypothetical protein